MGGLHRKDVNCTESIAGDKKAGENLCSLVWSTVPMPNIIFDYALFGDFESCVPSNRFFLSSGAEGCYPICFSACKKLGN